MLAAVLTPKRLELMKSLRQSGPLSVRALAKQLERDYKNVHADVSALEEVDLVQRTKEKLLVAPWDVIDAHVRPPGGLRARQACACLHAWHYEPAMTVT
jgi:predicted transcriptional regulator